MKASQSTFKSLAFCFIAIYSVSILQAAPFWWSEFLDGDGADNTGLTFNGEKYKLGDGTIMVTVDNEEEPALKPAVWGDQNNDAIANIAQGLHFANRALVIERDHRDEQGHYFPWDQVHDISKDYSPVNIAMLNFF